MEGIFEQKKFPAVLQVLVFAFAADRNDWIQLAVIKHKTTSFIHSTALSKAGIPHYVFVMCK